MGGEGSEREGGGWAGGGGGGESWVGAAGPGGSSVDILYQNGGRRRAGPVALCLAGRRGCDGRDRPAAAAGGAGSRACRPVGPSESARRRGPRAVRAWVPRRRHIGAEMPEPRPSRDIRVVGVERPSRSIRVGGSESVGGRVSVGPTWRWAGARGAARRRVPAPARCGEMRLLISLSLSLSPCLLSHSLTHSRSLHQHQRAAER